MRETKVFSVTSTLRTHPAFQVTALDIVKAANKADKIVKSIDDAAEVIKIEALNTKMLEE